MSVLKSILTVLLLSVSLYCNSQNQPVDQPLFDSDEILHLIISMDVSEVISERDTASRKYHDAILYYYLSDSTKIDHQIKIRVRGNNRSTKNVCGFPPLRLNFKKRKSTGTLFEGQDKLKLVTHCKSGSSNEEYILREYYIYKLYQIVTPYSFKVRLCQISYEDTRGKFKPDPHYGFIIEDIDKLAKRHDMVEYKGKIYIQDACDRKKLDHLMLFEYLIGNLDWSIPYRHNFKIISDRSRPVPIAVPYDFDLTGIVNKPTALPPPNFGISSVRERVFRGLCRFDGEYEASIEYYNEIKPEIYKLYSESEHLSEYSKKYSIKYLDSFYKILDNPKQVERKILKACWAKHQHVY